MLKSGVRTMLITVRLMIKRKAMIDKIDKVARVFEDDEDEGTTMGDKQYATKKIEGFGLHTKDAHVDIKPRKHRPRRRPTPALDTLLGKAATGVITGGELEALAQWFRNLSAVCAGMEDIPRLKFVMVAEDNASVPFICVPHDKPCDRPTLMVVLDE